jgi:hypothetical protein
MMEHDRSGEARGMPFKDGSSGLKALSEDVLRDGFGRPAQQSVTGAEMWAQRILIVR